MIADDSRTSIRSRIDIFFIDKPFDNASIIIDFIIQQVALFIGTHSTIVMCTMYTGTVDSKLTYIRFKMCS